MSEDQNDARPGTERFDSIGRISGATTVAAVIGDPIVGSLSPRIHNAAFTATGLDWVYVAATVPAGHGVAAVRAAAELGYGGLSITMPCKHEVLAACDEVTDHAAALDAVNCISFDEGRIVGANTDGEGLVRSLRDEGVDPANAAVLLLGAGGAASAIGFALVAVGASVTIAARRPERVRPGTATTVVSFDEAAAVAAGSSVVVNATPIGMDGTSLPLDPEAVPEGAVVVDTITQPRRTPWIAALETRGVHAVNGVGMLIGQGAVAFERWTGIPAPVDAMRAAVAD